MTRRTWLLAGAMPLLVLAAGIAMSQRQQYFPHARHERLFPVCEGCHAGVVSGAARELYPAQPVCARCHDGVRVKAVKYEPPGARASNLRFVHADHAARAAGAGDSLTCQSCHTALDGPATRMNVGAPQPARCVGCHAHRVAVHLDSAAACTSCHVPLAVATTLPAVRVAGFPRPPWHEAPTFLSSHGAAARSRPASCAVCHARQTCERCHANADRVPEIAALAPDARVALLEAGREPEYPVPPSHRADGWHARHGAVARRNSAACASCHTRPSCSGCHFDASGTAGRVIAALPDARPRGAPGVDPRRITGRVHTADVAVRHGAIAAAGAMQCAQCHSAQTCAACHAGTESRAFHAANFVERHATDVFAASTSCQSCHNTETFCRSCHAQSGIAAASGMNAAFHTAQPMWVLSHGQAARSGMESCASCHRQSDCVRCHSAAGGWNVNPHGPGFPATRQSGRNASSCGWCHAATPTGGT